MLASFKRPVLGLSPSYSLFTSSRLVSKPAENFLSGSNAIYVEQMYQEWKRDPQSVHASWRSYFTNLEGGVETPFTMPPLQSGGQDASV